jgi:hypothetical protein
MSELQQILEKLNSIETRLKYQSRLGLSGGRKYIAIEADKKSMWHYCDDDGTPIEENVLTGYIKRIERKDGDNPKLHIFVEADYEYVLVSGFSTHFSRQAMAAIASMSSQQLSLPVIIKPDTGNDDAKTKGKKPVFCNIIQDGRTIRSGQLGTRDAEELYQMAIAVLSGVGNQSTPERKQRFDRVHVSDTLRSHSRDYVPANSKPPGLDDEQPPMKAIAPNASGMQSQPVDWKAFCKQYRVAPKALKELATELGLPQGKLNPTQSAQLYAAAWKKFVELSA